MKKLLIKLLGGLLILIITVLVNLSYVGFVDAERLEFTDLKEGDVYYKEVRYLAENGIIHGYPDGSFKPNKQVNRAEVLKIVFLALKPEYFDVTNESDILGMGKGTPQVRLVLNGAATENTVIDFPDVPIEEWFFPYVKQARIDGMVVGCPDGKYYPEKAVNLAELLKIMFRNDNRNIETYVKEGPYNDVPKRSWFTRYFVYAKYLGIIESDASGMVYPDKQLTRGEVAKVVYNYMQEKLKVREGKISYYADYFHGRNTASGEEFDMYAMTAAHRELPFNTYVKVWNQETGESVIVRINDRGPYVNGVEFDLSKAAFESISHLGRGVMYIKWQIVTEREAEEI